MIYMEKKYKLTDETIEVNGKTLYRIEALKDFLYVTKGDRGGFIEKEENLSHSGNAWVFNDAKVFNDAIIFDNAMVYNNAEVFDSATVYNNAKVHGSAKIYNYATICDYASISDNAQICDATIRGCVTVRGNTTIVNSEIYDNVIIRDTAIIKNTRIFGPAVISHDAKISSDKDYIVFKNWWSSGRYFIWTRSNNMWSVGCFYGTGEELIEKAYKDSKLSGKEYKRVVDYVNSILKD